MSNAAVLLAGLLPLYVVRFSLFGIPTNVFEFAVWVTVAYALLGKTLGVFPSTPLSLDGERDGVRGIRIFILLFLLAAIISTILSPIPRNSLGILKGWVITPMLFGFLVYKAADKKTAIVSSLILSGLVVALFGLSQVHGIKRIQSLYDVPNSLALFLVPVSVIAGYLGLKNRNKLYQYAAITMLIATIFTQSAGAIIALLGTIIVGMFVNRYTHPLRLPLEKGERSATSPPLFKGRLGGVRKNSWRIFTFLFITITIFTLSGRLNYLISPLIHPGTTNSITVRMQLWDIGTSLIKKHSLLGIGLGQFEPAYQEELHRRFAQEASEANEANAALPAELAGKSYKLQQEFVFRDPHNWILSFWLNTGILGLMSFIGLNYLAIRSAFPPPYQGGAGGGLRYGTIYSQAVALALISMLIFGLFDTIYWKNDLSALWWMLISISVTQRFVR